MTNRPTTPFQQALIDTRAALHQLQTEKASTRDLTTSEHGYANRALSYLELAVEALTGLRHLRAPGERR
jgi:hypothetical protein